MDNLKLFRKIMNKSNSNKVVILTSHYHIQGDVYDCEDCNKESFINLTNVAVCNANESHEETVNSKRFDWLHVNAEAIVAYSFI